MTHEAGPGRRPQRGARAHPPLLHQGHGLRRPAHPDQGGRPRGRRLLPGPLEPRQGRPLHPRRELHRLVLVEGLRQGRDHHLGDPADRLPVGRARTARSTSPAAARAARRSPGTPTRRPGSATRTSAACCCRCTARPRPSTTATRSRPGRTSSTTRSGRRPTSPRAARAAWSAPPGTRPPRWSPPPTCTRSRSGARTGSPASRRSRRCRWSSHASGARFTSLIGGSMLSFYDWYADLPVASPQVFGDQTDVPESGDWWDAGYLIMWGSNVPVTRTPDAHWMTEARYRGQKVVVVSPDYADNVKFADEWLAAKPGTDGALAMAMGHVDPQGVLRRPADAVLRRLRQAVHRPALPGRARRGRRRRATGPASSSPPPTCPSTPARRTPTSRPCWSTRRTGEPVVPNGSLGHRFGDAGVGPLEPRPRRRRPAADACYEPRRRDGARSSCRASTTPTGRPGSLRRGGARCAGSADRLVTTVFDLMLAQYGVGRDGLPGDCATAYDDADRAVHPGLAGGDHRCARPRRRPGSRASSRRTPRSPAAAR